MSSRSGRDDKLRRDSDGDLYLVAKERTTGLDRRPRRPVTENVWEAARRCHVALGCRHYSLFDFRIDPGGKPWFLEAGLYCSCPQQRDRRDGAAAGIETRALFERAVSAAANRVSP